MHLGILCEEAKYDHVTTTLKSCFIYYQKKEVKN